MFACRTSMVCACLVTLALDAQADVFGSGANRFEIPFVTIGDAGNPADDTGNPNPAGSVDYVYHIGRYEVPEEAITKAIAQSEEDGEPLGINTPYERGPGRPATGLTWLEIAKFVNWLNVEKGASPAYKIDDNGEFQLWEPADPGYDPGNLFRNSEAVYFLPTVDEWYKAAYYDPLTGSYYDFATGSDSEPAAVTSGSDPGTAVWNVGTEPADVILAGGQSPYGTVGQSGNVYEWEETATDLVNDFATETRGVRGGDTRVTITAENISSRVRNSAGLTSPFIDAGFRIARVPEPTSVLLPVLLFVWRLSYRARFQTAEH